MTKSLNSTFTLFNNQRLLLPLIFLSLALLYLIIGGAFTNPFITFLSPIIQGLLVFFLYSCIYLIFRMRIVRETKFLRSLRRFICYTLFILSPVVLLLAYYAGGAQENGWDVRRQTSIPYDGMNIVVWFYGAGATDDNALIVRKEKQIIPGLYYLDYLYSDGGDSLLLDIKNDTLLITNPYRIKDSVKKVALKR